MSDQFNEETIMDYLCQFGVNGKSYDIVELVKKYFPEGTSEQRAQLQSILNILKKKNWIRVRANDISTLGMQAYNTNNWNNRTVYVTLIDSDHCKPKKEEEKEKRNNIIFDKRKFQVLILHGHSDEWKKLKNMVESFGFKARELAGEYIATTIFEQLHQAMGEVSSVIILMSADDQTNDNKLRARQNVIFEMGFCFGAFDFYDESKKYNSKDAIIVLSSDSVESFANIDGLKKMIYEPRKLGLKRYEIQRFLETAYEKAIQIWPDEYATSIAV